jgi:2'-5' RNA ligase
MSRPATELVAELAGCLVARGQMLATAESCTGGWVAKVCTDLAGSSQWFDRGFVTYSNEAKQEMLGVSAGTLARFGAVSEQTVQEMAAGALAHSRGAWALAISGVAGPGGGTPGRLAHDAPVPLRGRAGRGAPPGRTDRARGPAATLRGDRVTTGEETSHRLFFALWPDDDTRARLAEAARQWSDRPIAEGNLHMTLHFLGACSDSRQACCIQAAARVRCEPFELQMDYLGGRARSRIQWLAASHPPQTLFRLVDALAGALAACDYQPEKRPFLPHVTLSRKVRKPQVKTGLPAITWGIREFVLAESLQVDGRTHYRVRERWECG